MILTIEEFNKSLNEDQRGYLCDKYRELFDEGYRMGYKDRRQDRSPASHPYASYLCFGRDEVDYD